jgi:hypothetical protein
VLILLLAAGTAIGVVLLLLDPPGGVQRTRPLPAPPAPCAEGQATRCIGGKSEVIAPGAGGPTAAPVAPAANATALAPSRPASR